MSTAKGVCCAFWCGESCVESYREHVERALEVWRMVEPLYWRSIARAFGRLDQRDVDRVVETALILHDAGKLLKAYSYRGRFRHELIGAYLTYRALADMGEVVATAAALAVLLHHEPIIMSAYAGRYGERFVPVSTIKAVIERAELVPNCDLSTTGYKELQQLELKAQDVVDVLRRLVVMASVGSPDELLERRSRVAVLLHPIVLSDSVAAYFGRHICPKTKCERDSESTVVVRRALSGAELINESALKSRLCR